MSIIFCIGVAVNSATADSASHIVISEIKITGGSGNSTDEFVELYNPTEQDINLIGWSLIKKTAAGNEYGLVDDFGEQSIPAHSFFLIAHPAGYLGVVEPDVYYSTTNSVSSNNTIILLNELAVEIDKVGLGTALDFELQATSNPGNNKSIERKAKLSSTQDDMFDGGIDYFLGNGEDTDNNFNDFIINSQSEPQNSSSEQEYLEREVPKINNEGGAVENNFGQIIITELFPNPLGSDDGEFIELYNNDNKEINLAGWQLGDNSSRRYIISEADFDHTLIKPSEYLSIEKEISKISLNNTTDAAYLYDSDGQLVEKIEYEKTQENKSYSLIEAEWIWTSDYTPGRANNFLIDNQPPTAMFELAEAEVRAGQIIQLDASSSSDPDNNELLFSWDFGNGEIIEQTEQAEVEYSYNQAGDYIISLTVEDVWGAEDIMDIKLTVSDYDYSEKIILSEILPSCEGADEACEFIEIFNADAREINLDGWKLTDLKNEYVFSSEIIESEDYLVIDRKKSKITLNNSSDVIYLIDPAGQIINGVEYTEAKSDLSFSFDQDENKWSWTEEITPNHENIIFISASEDEVEIAQENLETIEISIGEVDDTLLGRILIVTGEVESATSTGIYLMDESGHTLRVYIQKKTDINKPDVEPGDIMRVVGVLDKTSAGLRLLPRTEEDITITKQQPEIESVKVLGEATDKQPIDLLDDKGDDKQVVKYLYMVIGFLVLIIIGITVKYFISHKKEPEEEIDYSE